MKSKCICQVPNCVQPTECKSKIILLDHIRSYHNQDPDCDIKLRNSKVKECNRSDMFVRASSG